MSADEIEEMLRNPKDMTCEMRLAVFKGCLGAMFSSPVCEKFIRGRFHLDPLCLTPAAEPAKPDTRITTGVRDPLRGEGSSARVQRWGWHPGYMRQVKSQVGSAPIAPVQTVFTGPVQDPESSHRG